MCVVSTLRTVFQVYSVQLCSRCVWGLMFSVMCCLGVARLLRSSALGTDSPACPFPPQVCNQASGTALFPEGATRGRKEPPRPVHSNAVRMPL